MKPAYDEHLRVLTNDAYLGTIRRVWSGDQTKDGEPHYDVELDIGGKFTYSECELTPIGGYAHPVDVFRL